MIVLETLVPKVVVTADAASAFASVAAVESIPNAVKVFSNLISETVHEYPLV